MIRAWLDLPSLKNKHGDQSVAGLEPVQLVMSKRGDQMEVKI